MHEPSYEEAHDQHEAQQYEEIQAPHQNCPHIQSATNTVITIVSYPITILL